ADGLDPRSVRAWFHESLEVLLVVNDPGDRQGHPRPCGYVDRLGCSLVRMNPPEEQQVLAWSGLEVELPQVDAVVNGGQVVEPLVAVRVADGDVIAARVVLLEDRNDPLGGKSVDRGDEWSAHQPAVGEWQEVEVVV